MGIYDTVSENYIQIKCTSKLCMKHYDIGQKIPLEDGLYLGYEGWFTVKRGRVFDYGNKVFNKWGDSIYLMDILLRLRRQNNEKIRCIEKKEDIKSNS